jgi:hypothetical protein
LVAPDDAAVGIDVAVEERRRRPDGEPIRLSRVRGLRDRSLGLGCVAAAGGQEDDEQSREQPARAGHP